MAPFNPNLTSKVINDFDVDSNISQVTITYEPITNINGVVEHHYKANVMFKSNVKTLSNVNNHFFEPNNVIKLNVVTKTDMSTNNQYYIHNFGMNSNPYIHPGQEIAIEEYIVDDLGTEVLTFEQVQIFVTNNTTKKKRKSTIIYTGPGIIIRTLIKFLRIFGLKRK